MQCSFLDIYKKRALSLSRTRINTRAHTHTLTNIHIPDTGAVSGAVFVLGNLQGARALSLSLFLALSLSDAHRYTHQHTNTHTRTHSLTHSLSHTHIRRCNFRCSARSWRSTRSASPTSLTRPRPISRSHPTPYTLIPPPYTPTTKNSTMNTKHWTASSRPRPTSIWNPAPAQRPLKGFLGSERLKIRNLIRRDPLISVRKFSILEMHRERVTDLIDPSTTNLEVKPYTLHHTPCNLHPTPYIPLPTPYTLHPAPCTLTSKIQHETLNAQPHGPV